MLKGSICTVLVMLCAGCSTLQDSASTATQDTLGQPIPADDSVAMIADAIEQVGASESNGSIVAADYITAIKALRSGGAQQHSDASPDEATLESTWLMAARALDPDVSIVPLRGRVLGPSYRRGILPPGSTKITTQTYLSGQKAKVTVVGQMAGSAAKPDLRLEIRQSSGKPVCLRSSSSPKRGCEWLPLFSDRYEITIINKDTEPVRYTLISN